MYSHEDMCEHGLACIKFAEGLCPKKLHYPAEEMVMLRQVQR